MIHTLEKNKCKHSGKNKQTLGEKQTDTRRKINRHSEKGKHTLGEKQADTRRKATRHKGIIQRNTQDRKRNAHKTRNRNTRKGAGYGHNTRNTSGKRAEHEKTQYGDRCGIRRNTLNN